MNADETISALIALAALVSCVYLICFIVYNDFIVPMREHRKAIKYHKRWIKIIESLEEFEYIDYERNLIVNFKTGEQRNLENNNRC